MVCSLWLKGFWKQILEAHYLIFWLESKVFNFSTSVCYCLMEKVLCDYWAIDRASANVNVQQHSIKIALRMYYKSCIVWSGRMWLWYFEKLSKIVSWKFLITETEQRSTEQILFDFLLQTLFFNKSRCNCTIRKSHHYLTCLCLKRKQCERYRSFNKKTFFFVMPPKMAATVPLCSLLFSVMIPRVLSPETSSWTSGKNSSGVTFL